VAARWLQFAQLVSGILIFTTGVVQIAFAELVERERNRALATLGGGGVLYGARLMASLSQIRELAPLPPTFWRYFDADITYVILVPGIYYVELTFGPGRRESIRWMWRIALAYAVAAIAIDALMRTPTAAKAPNGYLTVAAVVVLVWNSFGASGSVSREFRIVRIGVVAFSAFVLFENFVNGRLLAGRWNVEWAGVLVLLACLGYVAVSRAFDNARRLQELKHELETARQIQASILPKEMPEVAGLAVAARYLPMTDVAGDFYDFLDLGDGRLGVLIADVSGHGVPAALIASMVKVALVAQSPFGDDPARVLLGMNQIFCGRLERQFVTAAYAYLEPAHARLRYWAAGHPPALLVDAGGRVAEVANNGVMLGHFPDWPYTSIEQRFAAGDRLILYTDGLVEATDERGEFFDAERLCSLARDGRRQSADAFADMLIHGIGAWTGRAAAGRFADDGTIVVVDRVA
jgi:sigma-B regulation protein RsbU (phosphoserine phosphatase)